MLAEIGPPEENIIRYNYLHNISNHLSNYNVSAIYLDDCMSGVKIYGNVFYKVKNSIFVGGGRDYIIENNIIVDAKILFTLMKED